MSAPSGKRPLPLEPELCTADAIPITVPSAVRMSYSLTSSGWATGLNKALVGAVMVNVTDPRSPHPATSKAATTKRNRRMLRHCNTDGSQLNYARFIGIMEGRNPCRWSLSFRALRSKSYRRSSDGTCCSSASRAAAWARSFSPSWARSRASRSSSSSRRSCRNLVADQEFIKRFIDEAQVAIKLQHANIAPVFEVGKVDGEYFLAIEYIEGRDLRRMITRQREERTRLPPDLALFIVREMANGLAYAHRRTDESGSSLALVHCDISPPNVMVSFEGEVKIIDFGIAKSAIRIAETNPNMGFGKFGYMAPEQLIRGGIVDKRTDVYAAGVVLYELLTGERLFTVPRGRRLPADRAHGDAGQVQAAVAARPAARSRRSIRSS